MMRKIVLVTMIAVSACVLAIAQGANTQKQSAPVDTSVPPKGPEAIASYLLPDNSAFPERLKNVPREDAIKALAQVQPGAVGAKADAIAYLLVVLESDADANRQRLFDSLRTCARDPETCDDRLLSYLSNLFDRGDRNVLNPLLDASRTTDGALVEALGSTYDDLVSRDPRTVIVATSRRPAKDQRQICHMIAVGDGTGLPDENANEVVESLEKMTREVGPIASTAMMCLNEIKAFGRR